VADAARRQELAARGVQSRNRLALRQHDALGADVQAPGNEPFVPGQRYQFVENLPAKQPEGEPIAHIDAIEPLTAKPKWRAPIADHPHWSAMLATGEGSCSTGKMTGEFIAVDADKRQDAVAVPDRLRVNAQPVTFTQNGRQFVTCCLALAASNRNQAGEALKTSRRRLVWTFALMPE